MVDVLRCADGERKPPSRSSPLTSAFSRPSLSVTPFQLALLPRGRKKETTARTVRDERENL